MNWKSKHNKKFVSNYRSDYGFKNAIKTMINNKAVTIEKLKEDLKIGDDDVDSNTRIARKVYIEELVKNSMIEILEDNEIYKLTKTIKEESEYPLINYNFWTKTKNFESIVKTNEFFIDMKSTIIDHTVKNNETVLQSLVKAMENHQHEEKEKLIEHWKYVIMH